MAPACRCCACRSPFRRPRPSGPGRSCSSSSPRASRSATARTASSSPRTPTPAARSGSGRRSAAPARATVEEGWEDRWRAFHRPVRIGPLWVGPPWEEPDADAIAGRDRPRARVRHRRARDHPALPRAARSNRPRGSLLDVGCGSGVLSIAAAKLGFEPVRAIDLDPLAVEATERNAAANGVAVDVRQADALADPLPSAGMSRRQRRARRRPAGGARGSSRARIVTPATSPSEATRSARLPARDVGVEAEGWAADLHRPDGVRSSAGWRRSRSTSSAARSRTPMRRRCASGCSPTATSRRPAGDVAVVNTCCVTHEALRKSRHAASRAARTPRAGVRHRLRREPARPTRSPACRRTWSSSTGRSEETPAAVAGDVGAIGCVQADARLDRVRAFVKVQDGCSFSCSFCVIPLVRGASRSRRAAAVLAEVRRRVEQGHREVVLTGINLGCYRDREAGYDLPRLIREAGATPGLARLRLSSIEVNHVTRAAARGAARDADRLAAPARAAPVRATTASCARWPAATTRADVPAPDRARPTTST